MGKRSLAISVVFFLAAAVLISINVFAGKLYIKPDLELKRSARLLEEANADFVNAKIHITRQPEIALTEFEMAKEKYREAISIIEVYGAGYYSPGDVDDFKNRIKECDIWLEKSAELLEQKKRESLY